MQHSSIYYEILKQANLTLDFGMKIYMMNTHTQKKRMVSMKFGMVTTSESEKRMQSGRGT